MLDRAGDLALKAPDASLRVDEHSAHHPPPFRWLGNLFQIGPMRGHGDRAISPPTQRATVLPAVPTTSGGGREHRGYRGEDRLGHDQVTAQGVGGRVLATLWGGGGGGDRGGGGAGP